MLAGILLQGLLRWKQFARCIAAVHCCGPNLAGHYSAQSFLVISAVVGQSCVYRTTNMSALGEIVHTATGSANLLDAQTSTPSSEGACLS